MPNEFDALSDQYDQQGHQLIDEGNAQNDQKLVNEGLRLLALATKFNVMAISLDVQRAMQHVENLKPQIDRANQAIREITTVKATIGVITQLVGLAVAIKTLDPVKIDVALQALEDSLPK